MEKFPSSPPNKAEKPPERIVSSEEVLEALSRHANAERFTLGRELSDEQGVYLREVEVKGEQEGEVTEYQYIRKGSHGNQNVSDVTEIRAFYYQDGLPIGGEKVAFFNEETGDWVKG